MKVFCLKVVPGVLSVDILFHAGIAKTDKAENMLTMVVVLRSA